MLNTANYRQDATARFSLTNAWQQLCLDNLQFNNVTAYFTVTMGSALGVYLLDDASLTYRALSGQP